MTSTPFRRILLLWLAWASLLIGFQKLVVIRFEPARPDYVLGWTVTETTKDMIQSQVYLADPFMNEQVAWDSEYYLSIAVQGYDDPQVGYAYSGRNPYGIMYQFAKNFAFFPLYPTLMRLLAVPLKLLGMTPIATATLAGVIIALLGTLGGMCALYDLAYPEMGEEGALRAVFYLLIFPTGFFLAQVYTEGLFIGLAFGSLALMRRSAQNRLWMWAAALLAALAVLTRAVGLALALAIFVHQWNAEAPKGRDHEVRMGMLYAFLPGITCLIWYMSRLGQGFGFVERNFFGRGVLALGPSLDSWTAAWNIVTGNLATVPEWMVGKPAITAQYFALEFAAAALGLLSCALVWKKHPAPAAFSMLAWVISVSSGYPQSNIRYSLALPAIYLLLGRLSKNPVFDKAWTLLSLLLMGLLAMLFSFDYWVA